MTNSRTVISYVLLIGGLTVVIEGTVSLYLSLAIPALLDVGFGSLGGGLGFIAVGLALRNEVIIQGIRRTEVNEKIAILYVYAGRCSGLASRGVTLAGGGPAPNYNIFFGQMFADIRAIGSVIEGMKQAERVDCRTAVMALIRELRLRTYFEEADRVRAEFKELLG